MTAIRWISSLNPDIIGFNEVTPSMLTILCQQTRLLGYECQGPPEHQPLGSYTLYKADKFDFVEKDIDAFRTIFELVRGPTIPPLGTNANHTVHLRHLETDRIIQVVVVHLKSDSSQTVPAAQVLHSMSGLSHSSLRDILVIGDFNNTKKKSHAKLAAVLCEKRIAHSPLDLVSDKKQRVVAVQVPKVGEEVIDAKMLGMAFGSNARMFECMCVSDGTHFAGETPPLGPRPSFPGDHAGVFGKVVF